MKQEHISLAVIGQSSRHYLPEPVAGRSGVNRGQALPNKQLLIIMATTAACNVFHVVELPRIHTTPTMCVYDVQYSRILPFHCRKIFCEDLLSVVGFISRLIFVLLSPALCLDNTCVCQTKLAKARRCIERSTHLLLAIIFGLN